MTAVDVWWQQGNSQDTSMDIFFRAVHCRWQQWPHHRISDLVQSIVFLRIRYSGMARCPFLSVPNQSPIPVHGQCAIQCYNSWSPAPHEQALYRFPGILLPLLSLPFISLYLYFIYFTISIFPDLFFFSFQSPISPSLLLNNLRSAIFTPSAQINQISLLEENPILIHAVQVPVRGIEAHHFGSLIPPPSFPSPCGW